MLDEKKKWFLLNSGGGAQAFDSPAPLRVWSLNTTEVTGDVLDYDQDSGDWLLYDEAGTTLLQSDLASAALTKTFTGLTINTTYTIKYIANKSGFAPATVSKTQKTFGWMPIFMYKSHALPYPDLLNTSKTNQYGETSDQIRLTKINSIINVDTNLNIACNVSFKAYMGYGANVEAPYLGFGPISGGQYTPPTPIVVSGDSTYCFAFTIPTQAYRYTIADRSGTTFEIRLSNTGNGVLVRRGSVSKICLLNGSEVFSLTNINYLIVQWVGSTVRCGLYNPETGTTSWGAFVTGSSTSDIVITDFFIASSGTSVFTGGVHENWMGAGQLTDAQIREAIDLFKQDVYTPEATQATLTEIKGTSNYAAIVNNELAVTLLANDGTTTYARGERVLTIDNFSVILTNQNQSGDTKEMLCAYDHALRKISDQIIYPAYSGYFYDNHNTGSLGIYDNAFILTELAPRHYDDSNPSLLRIKQFPKGLSLANAKEQQQGNGAIIPGQFLQYQGIYQKQNLLCLVTAEWNGSGYQQWLVLLVSNDRGNTFTKYRICEQTAGNWFYPNHIYSEDDYIHLGIDFYDYSTSDHPYTAYVKINPVTLNVYDGQDNLIQNIGSANKISRATLLASTAILDDGAYSWAGTQRRVMSKMKYDGTTMYCIGGNGNNTGWLVYLWESASKQIKNIAFGGGYTINYAATQSDADNSPVILRDRVNKNTFYVIVRATISTKEQFVLFKTTDKFATAMTPIEVVSKDSAYNYARLNATANSDYTDNWVVVGTKKDGGGANVADLFLIDQDVIRQ